MFVAKFKLK